MNVAGLVGSALANLPPETAHKVTLGLLRAGLGGKVAPSGEGMRLFGRKVPNLLGLPGGVDKDGTALAGWRRLGVGFVEAGTVTPAPRSGNPPPRAWRVGRDSMVNWMGLPGVGLDAFSDNLAAYRDSEHGSRLCLGASIQSPEGDPDLLAHMAATLSRSVDFLTKNASCPNTEEGVRTGMEAHVADVRAVKRSAPDVPLLVKLAPMDHGALEVAVEMLLAAGADGFVACNTVPFASASVLGDRAPRPWPSRDGNPVGGYSGPALLPTSRRMVRAIREQAGPDVTIIGVGGIRTGDDARTMLDAGADAVQAYTALARHGASAMSDIASGTLRRPEPATMTDF